MLRGVDTEFITLSYYQHIFSHSTAPAVAPLSEHKIKK